MLRIFITLLVYMHVSGCASTPSPYLDLRIGYQLDGQSDPYRRTTQAYECSDNFKGEAELGLDWGRTRIGYRHQSWITCGKPFGNDKPETWADDIVITHTFGGKK